MLRAALSFTTVLVGVAAAEPVDHDQYRLTGWSVTPMVGVDAGIDVAAGIQVEAPFRLRLMATAGELTGLQAWGLKKLFDRVHPNADAMGELLEDQMKYAFVGRANLTWRPLADHGMFFGAGYTIEVADKNGVFATELEQATGEMLPDADRQGPTRLFETSVRIHIVEATFGWQWGLGRGFTLLASLGVLNVFHTTTTFTPQFTPRAPALMQAFLDAASNKAENAGTSVTAPQFSLYLGYTF